MHTRKRHQDLFQDLNRKLQHAEKDKEAPGPEGKVRGRGRVGVRESPAEAASSPTPLHPLDLPGGPPAHAGPGGTGGPMGVSQGPVCVRSGR